MRTRRPLSTHRKLTLSGFALLLVLALLPGGAEAREAKPAAGTISLELRTLDGKKASETREFTLPTHGEVAGTVELFEQTHWCRLETHETHDEQLRLGIDCYQGGRKREHLSFEFSVERRFEVGVELTLGELPVRGEQRVQIVATRH